MSLSDAGLTECQTEHGLLIAFGEFAQHIISQGNWDGL
jgi:hypothetical protein